THHPGQSADVILVAVGDHDRLDVLGPVAQIAEIREHQVDTEHVGGREAQPGVDHDDPAVVLDDRHVLPDLAQPAERQDPESAVTHARDACSSPWRSSIAQITSSSGSSSSTYGSRGVALGRIPSMWSAALVAQASGAIGMSR